MKRVEVYFDYISGYAYFAWLRLRRLCREREVELVAHPVLFAGLLNHWGQLGPAEIPAKRAFVYADGLRQAALEGVDFACPKYHPFNPLPALRASLREVAGERQLEVIDALWDAGWGRGGDYGDPAELAAALDAAGLEGAAILEKTNDPAVKEALKASTEAAIARGVFGVPTMVVEDELVWGSDRIHHVEAILEGRNLLDRERLAEILARPRRAERR